MAVGYTDFDNVTHAHREIDHCVALSFHATSGVKAGGREDMAVQPLTAMESKYNEPPEGDNGSGAGQVSRARIPLTLNPRKKGFTRIPLRRSLIRPLDLQVTPREGVRIGGMSKGLTPAIKHTKKMHQKHER